ncbi:MAG: hypothetical protein MUF25_09675, partial [Pirellulaceae bacterium]|nr:hypothetical protein [Pirellulaceae bacterium]
MSGSIIKLSHPFAKRFELAQQPPGQQVGLSVKGPALQSRVLAFQQHPLQVLPQDLQVVQQHPLEFVAALVV